MTVCASSPSIIAAGEKVYANEIYSSTPSEPRLYAVRGEQLPVSAVDDHGTNVLPLISKEDHRYPHAFKHLRIPGMAQMHSLTLNLGKLHDASHVSLWLTGWVFWTDSNGSRALMHNPSTTLISPYVQVRNRQGKWVTVIPDMGLPSGTNRTMRVDLTGRFLSADHHVRIVTNLCVYWDRIFFTTHERVVKPDREIPAGVCQSPLPRVFNARHRPQPRSPRPLRIRFSDEARPLESHAGPLYALRKCGASWSAGPTTNWW